MAVSTVLVVPMAPAPTGNGLAMRAGLLLEALAGAGPVDVVVVPVSGAATGGEWLSARARQVLVVEPDPPRTRADVVAQLSDPVGRAELTALEQLPPRARRATPASARAVIGGLRQEAATVVVLRSYLAPFGVTLARELRCLADRDRRRRRRRAAAAGSR